ncbi:uncharacterized protein C05D11.1-like [Stegodyphus dumicola]|uniref:uncharacterized protein C05D11.1-like n=1 Tax=Stegodyphus dumicola TaxID=202533 RepID=UPI0015AD6E3A|nr:uncharacterized protein C05D11.1-like [Stegodyphus dumicola]
MPEKYNYECIAEIVTDGGAKLTKYKSTTNGMTICIANVSGPLVSGYLCIATEAHDDDGLPHTLEHLVFMGSEKYPYKGILDLVANRCLAQGTNAWTDTDHTCYTVTTAGDEGFLKLLPIYLDHLLFPTLTDSAFITEVHHINGEGEDAGVVYCEMQASENSGESRCHLAMLRSMYPGHCGYKSETGGLLKNLRESTTNEKVRAYHKEFYRSENLYLIIVGQIDASEVFKALKPVEERIALEKEKKPFVRPWQSPVPPLPESVTLEIEYPCDEDEYGLIIAAWRGPGGNDSFELRCVDLLMDYFTDTSVSPLNRDFVEIEDPLCNQVDFTVVQNAVSCIYLHFSNVPVNRLKELKEKLFGLFQNFADGKEEFDMDRMRTLIKKRKLYILTQMENNPHDHLASYLIADFLYSTSAEDLAVRVQEIPALEKLLEKDAQFWVDLLKTYIVEGKFVIVLGSPSPKLSEKMSKEEKQRIEEQQKQLGPEGLKDMANTLKKAIEVNEVPPPKEMITSVDVPSVNSIKFHPIKRVCNASKSEDENLDYSISKMPCRFQLDVVNTNFVRFYVLMDTSHLSSDLRMYLPLFVELLDECAIKRNGEIVRYQDVVKQLAEDTISISASIGLDYSRFFCSAYAQVLCLELTVEEEKYTKSVQWIREILYQIIFEPARIKSAINKMITDVATMKRSAGSIVKTMIKNLFYCPESNHWTASMLRQHAFLSKLLEKLESDANEVISKLNEVREAVTKPEKMTVHLALNLDNMKQKVKPEEAWIQELYPPSVSPEIMNCSVKKCCELLKQDVEDNQSGLITGISSVESSYILQCAPGINDCTHPDYAPLLVLIQYLTQLEGPMWKQIRGLGLAYTYYICTAPDSGLTYLSIGKATHLVKAYKEARDIVESHLNGESKWEKELMESASSSAVFEIIEKIKTVADVAEESLKAYYRNIDMNYTRNLLEKISQVTTSDMERVGIKYLKPLFDISKSRCAICCHPNKVNEIVQGFEKFSRKLTLVPSLEESFMAKY